MATMDKAPLEGGEFEGLSGQMDPETPDWLAIARSAYDSSTSYLDENYRHQFEKNLDNFMSRHPKGSKYHTEAYKTRSRLFRPKSRTAIRKNEASLAEALFSAQDVVVLEAEDGDDPVKRRDAAYWHAVINYRLNKTIPWFKTVIGAFQETQVYGVVCSKQYWEYEEIEGEEQIIKDPRFPNLPALGDDGKPMFQVEADVVKDRPKIRLIEIENIRFDPSCDWTDPVNSSPYLIECMPMYVGDVIDRMTSADEKTGQPEWYTYSKAHVIAAGQLSESKEDTTKATRRGRDEAEHNVNDFETVWVHENLIRWMGEDYVYYTLSTNLLLSDPVPLKEIYQHGVRPYVIGCAVIEAHRPIPSSLVELGENLQAEANDIVNQRLDNVKLALLKRYFAKRNSGTDYHALLRGAMGGIVLTDDIESIKEQEVRDVTGSSYQEQTRLDTDYDDIAGVFSRSSVQNNRQLNETVGGLQLMSQSANKDTEYLIRTFVETWVEPVIRQLVLLEQTYEDDEHIHDIAMKAIVKQEKKAQQTQAPEIPGQPGMEPQPPEPEPEPEQSEVPMSEPQNVDVRVNVGFGNLSPDQRINKVMSGLKIMGEIAPWAMQALDIETVTSEIFGALGHKNGHKFFGDLTRPEQQTPPEIQAKMKELEIKEAELQNQVQYNQAKLAQDRELRMMELALKEKLTMEQMSAKLGIDQEKMMQDRELAGAKNLTTLAEVERKERELQFKAATGRQGI